jgi:orotate phosphoribosyltransferase
MQEELVSLLAARKGHFRLESGHHGELWLEIPRLYVRPRVLRRFVTELARRLAAHDVEAVCGPMVEGALLAQMVAEELDAKFYFAQQWAATRDDDLYPMDYRIPKAVRRDARDKRTAVVDDVINAGSAVRGAVADLQACGARLIVIGALLVLGSHAAAFATGAGVSLESLAYLPNSLWEPSACPLCASGVPLESSERSSVRPLKDT